MATESAVEEIVEIANRENRPTLFNFHDLRFERLNRRAHSSANFRARTRGSFRECRRSRASDEPRAISIRDFVTSKRERFNDRFRRATYRPDRSFTSDDLAGIVRANLRERVSAVARKDGLPPPRFWREPISAWLPRRGELRRSQFAKKRRRSRTHENLSWLQSGKPSERESLPVLSDGVRNSERKRNSTFLILCGSRAARLFVDNGSEFLIETQTPSEKRMERRDPISVRVTYLGDDPETGQTTENLSPFFCSDINVLLGTSRKPGSRRSVQVSTNGGRARPAVKAEQSPMTATRVRTGGRVLKNSDDARLSATFPNVLL